MLERIRVARDMSRNQFARKLDLDHGYFGRLLKGEKPISRRIVDILEHDFNLSREEAIDLYLVTGMYPTVSDSARRELIERALDLRNPAGS